MTTTPATDVHADLEALCESVASGAPVAPAIVERVRERAEQVRAALRATGMPDVAVDLVRETRDE